MKESNRYGSATTTQRGSRPEEFAIPRHTSRIVREDFLTECGSDFPTHQSPFIGPPTKVLRDT